MKKSLRRQRRQAQTLRIGAALLSSCVVPWTGRAAEVAPVGSGADKPALEKKEAESAGDYRNWFDVSVGGTFTRRDDAQFQQRYGLPRDAFGGVEDFHWERDIGKTGLFKIDGRGIFDAHDYKVRLELSDPDKGYVRAGYEEFRTWYDPSGGFFPRTGAWFSLFDDAHALDRGQAWFEAGLTLPDRPQITFRYSHQFRDGQKDSLVWGDSVQPGLPAATNTRGIIPAFWDIDEVRDTFTLDVTHALGKTDLGAGVRYELADNDNSRNMRRRAGEAADRFLTQREGIEVDMFNAHAFTETRLHERVLFTTGYSFTTLDSDITGSRIYGPDYDPIYDPTFARRQFRDEGFLNLHGGSQLREHVVNLNFLFTPWDHVSIVPAVRVQRQDLEGVSEFLETNIGAAPTLRASQEELMVSSDRGLLDVAESLEARYTGFTNWVLYARGHWSQGQGNQEEREMVLETGAIDIFRDTDFDRFTQKYSVGANWYPLRRLNFAAQYYHKIRQDDFDHDEDSTINTTGNTYPAFITTHDFETDDVNFRMTWRPFTRLTLVSRYDFQVSTVDMAGGALKTIESSEVKAHILSQSITWSPLDRIYLQGSVNYVWDETDTPADDIVPGLVLDYDNSYWNASGAVGYALDNKTDLQAQYLYYRADNYEDNSALTQPFGADAEEHGVTATITRRIRPNLRWNAKYGFFTNRDKTSGGHNNYDAHLVYSSMQYLF